VVNCLSRIHPLAGPASSDKLGHALCFAPIRPPPDLYHLGLHPDHRRTDCRQRTRLGLGRAEVYCHCHGRDAALGADLCDLRNMGAGPRRSPENEHPGTGHLVGRARARRNLVAGRFPMTVRKRMKNYQLSSVRF
jgi:hypothetical protein